MVNDRTWTFGRFELHGERFQLLEGSRPVRLERIPLLVLMRLLERPGHLVSRDDLVTCLWKDNVAVDVESGLHTAVRKLRIALHDSAQRPRFIETVPGKGYRFIAPVCAPSRIAVVPFEHLLRECHGGVGESKCREPLRGSFKSLADLSIDGTIGVCADQPLPFAAAEPATSEDTRNMSKRNGFCAGDHLLLPHNAGILTRRTIRTS